jgi:CSLREA domain-containing protein
MKPTTRMLIALPLVFAGPLAARAATINVTTTLDEYGTNPANCGLREALRAAETNLAFGGCSAGTASDFINLPSGRYALTRTGTDEDAGSSGDLDVSAGSIILQGGVARTTIIDASGLSDRVLHVSGGAVVSLHSVTVTGGSLSSGFADNLTGGGVRVEAGATLKLLNAVIDDNLANTGGGIQNVGTLIATRTTLSNNFAGNTGGGLFHAGVSATLTNVTVSGNVADVAGGIMANRAMTINNGTIARNTSTGAFGAGLRTGGNAAQSLAIKISNSLFADNDSGRPDDVLCDNPITTGGSNLIEATNGSGCTLVKDSVDTPRDLLGDDPHLAPLFDLGNGVPVHALMPDSVAIAAANASGENACDSHDARFRPRPLPDACDIGAYESVVDYVVGTSNDDVDLDPGNGICGTVLPPNGNEILCSLRAAIEEANLAPGTQTIRLATHIHELSIPGVNENPREGDLDISDAELLIIGNGVGNSIIEGASGFEERLLDLPTGVNSVALLGVQLRNGNSGSSEAGGALRMFTGNLMMFESQIDNSASGFGGGLYAATPMGERHRVLIERSAVARNTATAQGGGAYLHNAALSLRNSTVGENFAVQNGGGLKLAAGFSELIFSSISGNRVSGIADLAASGGGIHLTQSAASILRGTVIANNRVSGFDASAPDCAAPGFTGQGTGGISLLGYNWLGVSAGCALEAEGPNFLDLDPQLSQLHTLQSATLAPAPQAGSPLLDAIPTTFCADLAGIGVLDDQAGNQRPLGSTFSCDIGAFEGVSDLIFRDGFE